MKKIIIFSCILMFTILSLNLLNVNHNVLADEIKYISVNGIGEICVSPDFAKVNIGLQDTANSFSEGQTSINNFYNNLNSEISKLDESINVYVNYSSCYPSYDNRNIYLVNANITIETSKLDLIDKIISTAGDNGATNFCGVSYSISNIKSLYDQAIEKAMDDAFNKATAVNKDITLVCVNNIDVCSYSEGEKDSCVTICASVRVKYSLSKNINNEELEDDEDTTSIQTKDIANYPSYCI